MPTRKKPTTRDAEPAKESIVPCLWFDGQAEEAARFYTSGKMGDILSVDFTLMGQKFSGLNGGPYFKFNEAVSFAIPCESQAEVDRYWKTLSAVPEAEQCGWVKDRYGLSWQIVPTILYRLLADPDPAKAGRVMEVMLKMKKLDIKTLQQAYQHGK